ncbi:hypothetical protein JHJ32_08650 [Parapedobacter sp. ISTM3]|uniref:Glutathione synthase/RimK-type ligase, ATP-grasp superfamily n=1 Tax=Parapedobacter luteus TaxID=623280 RepID=A0A1T5A1I8_9SPHI|nr:MULTISPECIES: hypothetical protein [Parapedobacter]MBK1440051.1 hypothetical protein [Parapedobacter sp. ISTM3]SKB28862.1 hypothetical protein SAMN05660226_00448 [Parapedobacter luteus]
MSKPHIIGIKRDNLFSPNHIGNDRFIFELVVNQLLDHDFDVSVCSERAYCEEKKRETVGIFSMGRNKDLVACLKADELRGLKVYNSAFGVERCYRTNMVNGLIQGGIPYPRSFFLSTKEPIGHIYDEMGSQGVWIKRGDFHAIHKEDVSFVASREEAEHIVGEYALRGIASVVVSEHLPGDLVKFYGVRGTDFFYWFYPYDHNHHKYELYAEINGKSSYYPFDEALLKQTATKSAENLGVHIYGGDAIIGRDGTFHVIDLNDWPSFAPCREEAAQAITSLLVAAYTADEIKVRQ